MFVIVYLREPNHYTVVPEEFIMDLKEKIVKNYGINRNQARRIYFSKKWFENQTNNVDLDQQYEPNFDLPCTSVYPLPIDIAETTFVGRMIMFEDTFEAALQKTKSCRPQLPALYNPARLTERPIPRVELSADEVNEQSNDDQENDQENTQENEQQNTGEDEQEELETTFFDSVALNSAEIDAKPVVAEEDMVAFDDLFEENDSIQVGLLTVNVQQDNADSSDASANLSQAHDSFGSGIAKESTRVDAIENVDVDEQGYANAESETQQNEEEEEERNRQIGENLQKVLLYGKKVFYDKDVEYISLPNQKLEAIKTQPEYQDTGDRYFMAQKGNEFEEIRLPAKAVNGLRKMNEQKRSASFDIAFLKAMVIDFCTLKKIKEQESIDENIRSVIEELFEWRVTGDEQRLNSFGQLLGKAIDGIKSNDFKI